MILHAAGIIWAARHGRSTDPTETVIGIIFLVVVILIALIHRALANYDVVVKGGLPYCPRCNRQVSYRRQHCRACGYQFVTYGSRPAGRTSQGEEGPRVARRPTAAEEVGAAEWQRREEARAAAERARLQEEQHRREIERSQRESYYRQRGVEPGPWAWFGVLPDWVQAILLGLAISTPVVIAAVVYAMMR